MSWVVGRSPSRAFEAGDFMHDIKMIRDDPEAFDKALERRGLPTRARGLLALDDSRRAAILELQKAQERRNAASKEIGAAMARKDAAAANAIKEEVARLKLAMPEMESAEKAAGMLLENELAAIPNLPAADAPDGVDERDNVEVRRFGAPPRFPNSFAPKEHFEIGEALGLMDFETAAKLSGARFVVLKGALARLERALMQFMLDLHTGEHGYEEVNPPVLVRDAAMFGTAQLPKFLRDQFAAMDPVEFAMTVAGNRRLSEIYPKLSGDFTPSDSGVQTANVSQVAWREFELASEAAVGQANKLWLIP